MKNNGKHTTRNSKYDYHLGLLDQPHLCKGKQNTASALIKALPIHNDIV